MTEEKNIESNKQTGQIRVGKLQYSKGKQVYPTFENFTPIVVLTKSSKYGHLGPYVLKDEQGRIMENIWQFSKVYEWVPYSIQKLNQYSSKVVWEWPDEFHIKDGKLTPEFWKWRTSGMNAREPIRYPVGKTARKNCIGSLSEIDENKIKNNKNNDFSILLDYVESRKKIYFEVYCRLVKQQKDFYKLQERLRNGENLLIIEVDVAYNDMPYYKEKYNVPDDFIKNNTMLVTIENMKIVLNDTKYPCGHGYGLAMALLGLDQEWLS